MNAPLDVWRMRKFAKAASLILGVALIGAVEAYEVRSSCPVVDTDDFFFPPRVLEAERAWYSKHLKAMGEPSLSCGVGSGTEVYRFVWLRTFGRPIAVRVSRSDRAATLVAVELTGAGGYEPGSISKRIAKKVAATEWDKLAAALGGVDFWRMPTKPSPPDDGLDGAQWIIEGRRNSTYHVVDRWSPRGGPYRDAGLVFLKLAGVSVPDQDLY